MYYSQPGIFNVLDIKNVGLALLQRMGKPPSLSKLSVWRPCGVLMADDDGASVESLSRCRFWRTTTHWLQDLRRTKAGRSAKRTAATPHSLFGRV